MFKVVLKCCWPLKLERETRNSLHGNYFMSVQSTVEWEHKTEAPWKFIDRHRSELFQLWQWGVMTSHHKSSPQGQSVCTMCVCYAWIYKRQSVLGLDIAFLWCIGSTAMQKGFFFFSLWCMSRSSFNSCSKILKNLI